MKIISHRGNLRGRIIDQENHPLYVDIAIVEKFDVEVDVWFVNDQFYLGHDHADHLISDQWLLDRKDILWCHAKNNLALFKLMSLRMNAFWHETDRFTITSNGTIWCYPENFVSGGITVVHGSPSDFVVPSGVYGICTDYPISWKAV